MRKIQILGTGCPKCQNLAQLTQQAMTDLGLDDEIIKVTDINDIMAFGVMMTPALAIDGSVKLMGKLPSLNDLKEILSH